MKRRGERTLAAHSLVARRGLTVGVQSASVVRVATLRWLSVAVIHNLGFCFGSVSLSAACLADRFGVGAATSAVFSAIAFGSRRD